MQTFLPYPDVYRSAQVLDNKRLGKQRVEAVQIARALLGVSQSKAWRNHPAVLMWKGYERFLVDVYLLAMIKEWGARGFRNDKSLVHFEELSKLTSSMPLRHPPWFGDEKFHSSHRSALLRKNAQHYGVNGWTDDPDAQYVWPATKP